MLCFPARYASAARVGLLWIEWMHDSKLRACLEAAHVYDRGHAVDASSIGTDGHVAVGTLPGQRDTARGPPIARVWRLKDDPVKRCIVGLAA